MDYDPIKLIAEDYPRDTSERAQHFQTMCTELLEIPNVEDLIIDIIKETKVLGGDFLGLALHGNKLVLMPVKMESVRVLGAN